MAYYQTCPLCRSNNDPGEACDCHTEIKKEAALLAQMRPKANNPDDILSVIYNAVNQNETKIECFQKLCQRKEQLR